MYRAIWVLMVSLVLILSACDEAAYSGQGGGGDAVAQLEAARRQMEEAEAARRAAEAAMQSAKDQIAIGELHMRETQAAAEAFAVQQYANLTATAGAQDLEITRAVATQYAAGTLYAQATEIAGDQATATQIAGATQTAWPATATVIAATQAAEAKRRRDMEMWADFNTWVVTPLKMAFWPAAGILFLIALGVLGVKMLLLGMKELPQIISLLKLKMMIVPRGKSQSPLYPVYLPGGRIAWVDIDKSVSPVTTLDPNGLVELMGMVDQAWQRQHNQAEQAIKAVEAFPEGSGAGTAAQAASQMLATNQTPQISSVAAAPWDMLARWSDVNSVPIGLGAQGAIALNWEEYPHAIVAGTSGGGKSRRFLIPVMADALVKGKEVILINAKGGDFAMLRGHPNLVEYKAHETDAQQAAEILEKVQAEVWERSGILDKAGVGTWSRLPHELRRQRSYLFVVVDELVDLAFGAEGDAGRRIWQAVIRITSVGRAMNVSFVTATTDPTEKTLGRLGMVARSNLTPILFRVMSGAVSQALLGQYGAEKLEKGHFMVKLGTDVIEGVAYDPKDSDIQNMMVNRPAPMLPASTWQDHEVPTGGRESSRLATDPEIVRRVLELGRLDPQPSLNEIQRQVWPGDALGGAHLEAVKEILRREGLYPNGNGR